MDLLFFASLLAVLPFWFLMIGLPTWPAVRWIVGSPWVLVALPFLYAIMLVCYWGDLGDLMFHPTLEVFARILGQPAGATICWMHLLAIDFFVGRWAYLDSRERGLKPWLASLALAGIFLAAPLGLLVYLAIRGFDGCQKPPPTAPAGKTEK